MWLGYNYLFDNCHNFMNFSIRKNFKGKFIFSFDFSLLSPGGLNYVVDSISRTTQKFLGGGGSF